MERFGASWDRGLKVSTWLIVLLMLGLGGGMLVAGWFGSGPGGVPVAGLLLGGGALLASLPVIWALAPTGYAVEGGDLVVERPLWPVRIPLSSIRSVAMLPAPGLGMAVRTGGCSGLFGHYGHFWSSSLGAFRLYATRRHPLVSVDAERARFVLSPDHPERFVAAVLRHAPRAQPPHPSSHAPGGRRPGGAKIVAGALLLAMLVAGAIVGGALGWAPRGVTVTDEAVRVERRWAGPVLLPLDTIRSAEPLAPGASSGWRRVSGTSGLGSASYGHFASRQLGDFTLYAWRRGPYVLLETADGKVVLTPDDPDLFLEELRPRLRGARP